MFEQSVSIDVGYDILIMKTEYAYFVLGQSQAIRTQK